YERLVFCHKLYKLREERDMKPETFASLVSAFLYEKRFGPYFFQPVIAGLGDDDKPFICTMDSTGAKELAKDFVVAGTASESLYGACESMFKPDMGAGDPDWIVDHLINHLCTQWVVLQIKIDKYNLAPTYVRRYTAIKYYGHDVNDMKKHIGIS
nr:proteasome subunit beta type-3-A [Tanacetum cinerariifolium]